MRIRDMLKIPFIYLLFCYALIKDSMEAHFNEGW